MPTNEDEVTHIDEVEHPALPAKYDLTKIDDYDKYAQEFDKLENRKQYLVFPSRLAEDIGILLFTINCASNFFIFKYLDYRREHILERIRLQEMEAQRKRSMKTQETNLA